MEISLKYLLVRLDSLISIFFATVYIIGGDSVSFPNTWTLEDRVRILTGISISVFYLVKTVRSFEEKSEIKNIKERINKLENDILENKKTPLN